MRSTAALAAETLPPIWLARVNCSLRSSSVAVPLGLRRIANGCVFVWFPTVRRTWYCPGGAAGPRTPPAPPISPLKSFASGYLVSPTQRVNPRLSLGGGRARRGETSGAGGGGVARAARR